MSATNRGAKRSANDLYQTPQWCIDILADRVAKLPQGANPDCLVVDAGAGDGRIGTTVMARLDGDGERLICVENDPRWKNITPRLVSASFLDWLANWFDVTERVPSPELVPVVFVSNPPFSQAEVFVRSTVDWMRRGDVAVFLLRLNWLGSERRAEWLNRNPPSRITVLAPRPSFKKVKTVGKDGKVRTSSNDACEYAWVWWGRILPGIAPPMTHFEVAVRPKGGERCKPS